MATTTSISIPNPSLELFKSPTTQVGTEVDQKDGRASPVYNRSSSLSDIGDHGDEVMAEPEQALSVPESDPNDTEAETERLEESPQRLRKTQNLVLTNTNPIYDVSTNLSLRLNSIEEDFREETKRSSVVASSPAPSMENDQGAASLNRPRKRKRSSVELRYLNDQKPERGSIPGDALRSDYLASSPESSSPPANRSEKWNQSAESSHEEDQGSGRDNQVIQDTTKVKAKRGMRKARKANENKVNTQSPPIMSIDRGSEPILDGDVPDANPDDVEMEDSGEYAGSENINRDEEAGTKKKSAMDSLNAIERCFASLRDKLFDERLAKLDVELAMLAEPNVTHPELFGMNQVLEQRRDEKIQHENTLLKYKLGSLENKSKAEKAQAHGQYMQSVRDIRDWNLEQVNKEWYQIHKERLGRENNVPEYLYQFPTRRSQQITHQTAYNKEVSVLSGIAKYRGFPAAPEICGAKRSEIESDFEKMGIAIQQPAAPRARHAPSLRASLSASAVLQRSKSIADEHFLEQNPWANPKHPAHLHRQASALSRTASPSAVSATQKRPSEPSLGVKSTSTLAGPPTRASEGANPRTDQQTMGSRMNKERLIDRVNLDVPSSTPSKRAQSLNESLTSHIENQEVRSSRECPPLSATLAPPAGRNAVREIHVRPYMPQVSSISDNASTASASKAPISPPHRFPTIKAEDITRLPGRTPTPQQYHQPIQVAVNGGIDWFAAS
ncbi:MAG: hypothetical protein Q9209_005104 [Squamulea sp. 1 TL-2023]